jgi:hypothetical protein
MCVFKSFSISRRYDDIGLRQTNCTDTFCWTVVSSHCRRSTSNGNSTESEKILYREEIWLCQMRFELNATELGTYPTFSFWRIFATLYISDHCDTERSFSSLKYIKHYLRSLIGEERLTNLLISKWAETLVEMNYTIRSLRNTANSIVVCLLCNLMLSFHVQPEQICLACRLSMENIDASIVIRSYTLSIYCHRA